MTYFEEIMTLPTVEVVRQLYSPNVASGLLGKLKVRTNDAATLLIYAPDLGYELRGDGMDDPTDYLTIDVPLNAIRETPALTKLDEFVAASMLRHPSIFPTRETVLAHTFLVLGNGLEWNSKGLLGDRHKRKPQGRQRMSYEGLTMDTWNQRDFYRQAAERIATATTDRIPDDFIEKMFAEHVAKAKKTNAVRQRRELFLDYYATLRSKHNMRVGHYESPISIAHLVEAKYLPMSNIPYNADWSFLEGAIEILTKATNSAKGTYRNNPRLDPPADPDMPSWMQRMHDDEDKDEIPVTEDDKKNMARACLYVEDLISRITVHIRNTGWGYVKVAQNAFKAVGWKKSSLDASNGTGWCGAYAPRLLTADDLALIERRLTRKGFTKEGLTWSRPDWHVSVALVPVGDHHRGQILIITHPEDNETLRGVMQRSFDTGWIEYLRREVIGSIIRQSEVSAADATEQAKQMGEMEMIDLIAQYPRPKERW